MLNIKKVAVPLLFTLNLLVLLFLKVLSSIDLSTFPIDYNLASSNSLKNYLLFIIIMGQIFLITQLTKIKFIRNLSDYKIEKEFYGLGPFLIHTQHHPSCSCYENHELLIHNQRICSGCYGSSLGILLGIIGILTFSIIKLPFDVYFYSGVLFIQLALLKSLFKSYVRFFLNVFFPLGVNLILFSALTFGIVYVLLFIPFLLIEFLIRLTMPSFDIKTESCPDGLVH